MKLPPIAHRIEALLGWARERWILVAAIAAAVLGLVFLKLASEVLEGDTSTLDARMLVAIRTATEGHTPIKEGLRALMRDLTALGDPATLILFSTIAVGYLLVLRRRGMALLLAALLALGTAAEIGLKALFDRSRPTVVAHMVEVGSASFPSGHAMDSTMIYMTIAALIARTSSDMRARAYVLLVALAISLGVGISRLYLGVHWPTDVLAGWIAGSAWALAGSTLTAKLQQRRQVERPSHEPG